MRVRRTLLALLVLVAPALAAVPATGAGKATLQVTLSGAPATPGYKVTELYPGDKVKISCPPKCSYTAPGPRLDVGDLRITGPVDPAAPDGTGHAFEVATITGCTHTNALPSVEVRCSLPQTGQVKVSAELRYDPVVRVGFIGFNALSISLRQANDNKAPAAAGHEARCDPSANGYTATQCGAHFSPGSLVELQTASVDGHTLVGWTDECKGQGIGEATTNICHFPVMKDTCILSIWKNGPTPILSSISADGPNCTDGSSGSPGNNSATGGAASTTGPPATAFDLDRFLDNASNNLLDTLKRRFLPLKGLPITYFVWSSANAVVSVPLNATNEDGILDVTVSGGKTTVASGSAALKGGKAGAVSVRTSAAGFAYVNNAKRPLTLTVTVRFTGSGAPTVKRSTFTI